MIFSNVAEKIKANANEHKATHIHVTPPRAIGFKPLENTFFKLDLKPTPASAAENKNFPHLERKLTPVSENTPIVFRPAIRTNHRINIGKDF